MRDYMYSFDKMVVPVCHVDLLHAICDVNGSLPDYNRFILYQTLVVESGNARLMYR